MNPESNQTGGGFLSAAKSTGGAAISVAASAIKAQIEAALVVAKRFPRDQNAAVVAVLKSCERTRLAEQSRYRFPRGNTSVTGPSIRLAEVIAQQWGNLQYGIIERERLEGSSVMVAYAHDLESNTRVEQEFSVRHWRDKKGGGEELSEERDIYEITANMGARRLRACILRVIPGDVVDAALDKCDETVKRGDGVPIVDRIRNLVIAFDAMGVTIPMIEARLGHKLDAIKPDQLVEMRDIYASIRDGMSGRDNWFDPTAKSSQAQAAAVTETPAQPKTGKPAPQSPQSPQPRIKKMDPPPGLELSSSSAAPVRNNHERQELLQMIETARTSADISAAMFEEELCRRRLMDEGTTIKDIPTGRLRLIVGAIDKIIFEIENPTLEG